MSIYRTYFTKDNTILKNKYVNTGQNPVTEIYYGTSNKQISRYIFDFDITEIKNRKIDVRIPLSGVTHTLKMTNTLAYDKSLLGSNFYNHEDHASSFELVLFKVPQFWDEGVGYDYQFDDTILDINGKVYATASNWYESTDIVNWLEPGIYSGSTSSKFQPLQTIHFDLGNEDIEIDLTSFIEGLIATGTTNFYGLGLAFTSDYETLATEDLYSVGFFGKDTNTFFEPFIETKWEDSIDDDRNEFFYDKPNKLYLYTNERKNPKNLDSLPTSVTINDYNGDQIMVITTGITHVSKGVYSVNIELNSADYDGIELVNFTDTWSGLIMNGRALPDAELVFTVIKNRFYNIGNDVYEPDEFSFTFNGIKRAEKIPQGEVRKVIVEVKEMFGYDPIIVDNIYYRLFVKQGRNQIDIITSSKINKAFQQNYFYLDTSWMIPQEYFLEMVVHSNGIITKKDDINFMIVDSVNSSINFQI